VSSQDPARGWRIVPTAHFRLHVRRGSASERRVRALGDSAEAARAVVLRLLEIDDRAQAAPVELYFADTRAEMTALVGRPASGVVPRRARLAYLLAGAAYRPLFRHELTHVYSLDAWGEPGRGGVWLSEGLATLATGACAGVSIDARAADLARQGLLVPLPRLAREFSSLPEPVAYGEAASVLQFVVRARGGIGAVRALWRAAANPGPRQSAEHPLGADGARIERAWLTHLRGVQPVGIDTTAVLRNGC